MESIGFSRGDAVQVSRYQAALSGFALRVRSAGAASLLGLLLIGSVASLKAASKSDLEIGLVAQRVVREGTTEKLVDQSDVEPGQVVQYTAAYRNRSERTLSNLAPTLPIPHGTEFIPESARPLPTEASIDGKTFEPYPIRRSRKLNNGLEVVVDVPASSYRALRWSAGDLSPTSTFITSARVRIIANNE